MLAAANTVRSSSLSAVSLLGLSFLAYALATAHSLFDAGWLLSLAASFVLGSWLPNVRPIWLAFCGILFASLLSIPWLPYGLWGNPNILGVALVLALAGAISFRLWWFIPAAALGIWYTASRGAAFAAGITCLAALWRYSRFYALLALLVAALAIVSQSEARLPAIATRLGIWHDTIDHLTYFGAGWGAFFDAYYSWPLHINFNPLVRPQHVYNDYLEAVYTWGLGAILLWLFIAACLTDSPQGLILFAFALSALTFFPASVFPAAQLFALTLGQLWRKQWQDGAYSTHIT